MASFIQTIDLGIQATVFDIFGPIMSLTEYSKDIDFNPKNIAFRNVAEKRGTTQMEFMSIWREPPQFPWERNRTSVARHGLNINEYRLNVKAVPVDLEYEITFWSQDFEIIQQVSERYLFWVHKSPKLSLVYEYGDSENPLGADFYMKFGRLKDDSQIVEQFTKGKYIAYTMPIKVEGWVFENLDAKEILHIYAKVYDFTKTEDTEDEKEILLTEWEEHATS